MELESWRAQLRKGAAELAVLGILARGEAYGVTILAEISRGPGVGVAEGTIYPLLNRLQKAGKITSRWVDDPGASHPRKYYRLTEEGDRTYREMSTAWLQFRTSMDTILTAGLT